MTIFRPPIEPKMLTWARETAVLSPVEAARLIGVSEDAIERWEAGASRPTIKQLRAAASVYQQPITAFLLDTPPPESGVLVAFRTLPNSVPEAPTRPFVTGLQRAMRQQAIIQHLAELAGDEPISPGLRLRPSMDPEQAGGLIRDWLGIGLAQQLAWRSNGEAFRQWSTAVEEKQILVVQIAGVALAEMRAFAEQSWPFPVLGLNGKDSVTGKTFSLIHELVHILLANDHRPSLHVLRSDTPPDALHAVESFCNQVAAAALMPADDLMALPEVSAATPQSTWSDDEIRALGNRYRVSRQALLLRLVVLGKTSQVFYQSKKPQFDLESRIRAEQLENRFGGGNFYQLKARDLGRRFVTSVLSAYDEERISSRDVTQFLGVQSHQLLDLAKIVGYAT